MGFGQAVVSPLLSTPGYNYNNAEEVAHASLSAHPSEISLPWEPPMQMREIHMDKTQGTESWGPSIHDAVKLNK
jgi:hypothetical protein